MGKESDLNNGCYDDTYISFGKSLTGVPDSRC